MVIVLIEIYMCKLWSCFISFILEKELIKRNNDASGRRCKLYIFTAELAERSPAP